MEIRLENQVARLLEEIGYKVSRGPKLLGRSGLNHRPDITFEVNGRLFIVECKSHFTRKDTMSVYGKSTDLNVSHVFLVAEQIPAELAIYLKKFDLTLLVLRKDAKSEKDFKIIVRNTVSRIISSEEESRKAFRLQASELGSFYFVRSKPIDLEELLAPIPKVMPSISSISDRLVRIDFEGSIYNLRSSLQKIIKEKYVEKMSTPEFSQIAPFLRLIVQAPYCAKIVRFGMATQRTYIVTNIRFFSDAISPDELMDRLSNYGGELTSLSLRLPTKDYLTISRTTSLHLRYHGKYPATFRALRHEFERFSFRD